MAKYGLRYRAGFHDIFGKYHEAIVYKKGHAGAGSFVSGSAEPVEIKINGSDEDVFEPVRASELTLNLKATEEGQFDELYSANDRDYRVDLHPTSPEASAMFALEEVDETSLADPYVHLRFDETAVQQRIPAYAEVNCTKQIYAGFNGKVRIYAKVGDYTRYNIASIDVVLLNSIDTVHDKIVDDINNRNGQFRAEKINNKVRIYADTTYNLFNGTPIVVETNTSFIQFEKTPFQGGVEGSELSLYASHPTPDPTPSDWWYTGDGIISTKFYPGHTLEGKIDAMVADSPKQSSEFPNINIVTEKISANEIKITLQGAGSFGEGWRLSVDGIPAEYYKDNVWTQFPSGSVAFYGGSSESNISTLQVDKGDGNGWTDIASYTRQAGDTLETIINRLVDNVNATTYTAVKRGDNMLIVYAPTGEDAGSWDVRWHFVGNNQGSASGFSFVNYDKVDWTGYVIPGIHVQPHDFPPYDVTISATDGLADLKTKNLEDILTNFERISELDLLAAVLQQTGLNLSIRESVNLYETSYAKGAADSSLKQTHIPAILFRGKNLYDTLKLLLEKWLARICQVDGQWVIERIPEKASNYATRTFAADGRFLTSDDSRYEQSVVTGTQGGGQIIKHTSPVAMVGAVKSVTTRLDYGLKEQLINFPNFEEGWDEVWSGRIGFMRTDESGSGLVIIADNEGFDWGHENGYAKQTFSIYNSTNQEYRFSTKYYYREKYDAAIAIDGFKMIVKLTGTDDTPYWLGIDGNWSATEQEITCEIEYQKRNEISIDIPTLPDSGDISVYVHELDGNSYHEVLIDYVKFEIIDDFPSGEHVELGYEKNIVVKKIFSYDGNDWTVETKLPGDTYMEKKEVNFVAGDAPSIDNRENMYTNCTTTPDGEFTFGWGAGDPLNSIIRNELLNQLGTYSARVDADMVVRGFKYNHVLLDTQMDNKKLLPTSLTYSVMSAQVKGTFVEIGKAVPADPKKEYFKPWKEKSTGNAAYSVNNTQAGSNISVTIPADVLREGDIMNALNSSSTTNPLSAAMGKELLRLINKAVVPEPETQPVISSGTLTLNAGGASQMMLEPLKATGTPLIDVDFTIAITNDTDVQMLSVMLNISGTRVITFPANVMASVLSSISTWDAANNQLTIEAGTNDYVELQLLKYKQQDVYILKVSEVAV